MAPPRSSLPGFAAALGLLLLLPTPPAEAGPRGSVSGGSVSRGGSVSGSSSISGRLGGRPGPVGSASEAARSSPSAERSAQEAARANRQRARDAELRRADDPDRARARQQREANQEVLRQRSEAASQRGDRGLDPDVAEYQRNRSRAPLEERLRDLEAYKQQRESTRRDTASRRPPSP